MEQINKHTQARPNIAILLATYNGEKYIKEQIDSILSQTHKDWHLFIHDDGSKDGTPIYSKPMLKNIPNRFLSLTIRLKVEHYTTS